MNQDVQMICPHCGERIHMKLRMAIKVMSPNKKLYEYQLNKYRSKKVPLRGKDKKQLVTKKQMDQLKFVASYK